MLAKMHARKASRHGSSGGSSGGTYASYSGGSSGGSAGGSTGYASYSSPRYSTPVVHSVSLGATSAYESPVVESSYQTYTPMGQSISGGTTVIQGATIQGGAIQGGTVIQGGAIQGGTVIQGGAIQGGTVIQGGAIQGGTTPVDTAPAETSDSARYNSSKPALQSDAAVLTVAVPSDAVVLVNGHQTTSVGSVRQFKSRGLKEGYVYTYEVKATFEVDGTEKSETKTVKLRSGTEERIEFVAPEAASETTVSTPVAAADTMTVVRLNVPADAKVTLAGNATKGQGSERTFRTRQLKSGQKWADYTIRVTAVVDGQSISKERTIDVLAGSTNELSFRFDDNSVAVR